MTSEKKDKPVSQTVKSVLEYTGKNRQDVANALGLSSTQAVTNKYTRDSFSAHDLLKIADCVGLQLAFINSNGKVAIAFPSKKEE